jgi:hypothetical protein
LLQQFLSHYLPAARELRSHYLPELRALHPMVGSWLDVSADSWVWGWACRPGWTRQFAFLEAEHHLGTGFLTPIACVVGLYLGRAWPLCRVAAAAAFILWFATTYIPGNQIAMLAAGVSYYCAAGLFHEVDQPASRAIAVAIVLCLLLLIQFPNPYLLVLGLTLIILCLLEVGRARACTRDLILPGIALAMISLKLFGLQPIEYGIMIIAPMAALSAYYWRSRLWEVGLGSLAMLMLFLILITFADRPGLLIATLAVATISLAVSAPQRYRPPARLLSRAMLIALASVLIFYGRDSLWLAYSGMIPGAVAIRAVGRIVLILLVPAALGLACLIEFLDQRRWTFASWTVVLLCLAEQGVTTETYDAAANRASIEKLASKIDQGRVAFYYHPDDGLPFYRHHLDAMWASLVSGVPTVNGYSGYTPRAWNHFYKADTDPEADVAGALADWEQTQRLLPEHVQWIGAERPALSRSEMRRGHTR